ncbi:HAD family hydrolase [Alcanivorax sp. 1008]|uniref:HAD family hydrolase n=1 Tax=Alcanivorax sp. 1008 TaxID=2816853 RepID=UPI001D753496|nr:HAD hydrolase-like protein [Alcanivorax sp. 1008]MCC1495978.1 HAD family hydrolase [Alcanivorax sp. 1008]
MRPLDSTDVFFFDCDGVILDSNEVKSSAFSQALPDEPLDLVEQFIHYHKENGGVSRYTKFLHFFSEIKGITDFQKEYELALARYETITREALLSCPCIPGVMSLLLRLREAGKKIYVVSGGAEYELHEVFAKRNLAGYFDGIYGSPKTKIENMAAIIETDGRFDHAIYFGDAKSDYIAAKQHGANFVFVAGKSEWQEGKDFCNKNGIEIINDFNSNLIKDAIACRGTQYS